MKTYKIALIPGDGIGKDVIAAAWQVLEKVAAKAGFRVEPTRSPGPAPTTRKRAR